MKITLFLFLYSFFLLGIPAFGYEGPSPLKDVKIDVTTTINNSGIYQFKYKVTCPMPYDGEITSIDLFLPWRPDQEQTLSSAGLTHCPIYSKTGAEIVTQERPAVPVGSSAPKGWMCGYGMRAGYSTATYGWSAGEDPTTIKPGASSEFSLTSYGLPAVREILIEPDINLERLPEEYKENLEKTIALTNKVKWLGKTIGPKAPPKIFSLSQAIVDLKSLLTEAAELKWLQDKNSWRQSIEAKLDAAKKKLDLGDKKSASNILNALLSEIDAQKNKQLTSEGYALLYYNVKYLISKI
jgi:hypothetical protein